MGSLQQPPAFSPKLLLLLLCSASFADDMIFLTFKGDYFKCVVNAFESREVSTRPLGAKFQTLLLHQRTALRFLLLRSLYSLRQTSHRSPDTIICVSSVSAGLPIRQCHTLFRYDSVNPLVPSRVLFSPMMGCNLSSLRFRKESSQIGEFFYLYISGQFSHSIK